MSELATKNQRSPSNIRSKHRLAEISHHFLSNENERSPAWQNTTTIPVLLGSKHDDYIVYELNRAFNRHDDCKNSSMVLNIESRLTASSVPNPLQEMVDDELEESSMPKYCLVPVTSPPTTMALQCDRFIIAVHASLGGVRVAYDQLAFMASLETDFNVCVIMLGAKNMRDAKRFFGFLCDNAQSLLALELECGGFLLQDHENSDEDSAAQTDLKDDNVATDFDGVANGILKTFSPSIKPIVAASLARPAGVAALLS